LLRIQSPPPFPKALFFFPTNTGDRYKLLRIISRKLDPDITIDYAKDVKEKMYKNSVEEYKITKQWLLETEDKRTRFETLEQEIR